MQNDNIILLTDSYKLSHAPQYPPGTTRVHSYLEPRVGAEFPNTVFFGLQYLLKRYLTGEVVTRESLRQAAEIANAHMGGGIFNSEGWQHIIDAHAGRLPINVWAVPEGSVHPAGTPLIAIENTDPACWWLTNALETLLVQVWYPTTVATLSRQIKTNLIAWLSATGCEDIEGTVAFMLHDFGCRGVSSMESAAIGGAGHLVNFMGTDTVPALTLLRDYYGQDEMPAFSVPASEHSTMTSWGPAREADAYRNMLWTYPEGIVSIVADSYDLFNAASNIFGGELRDMILQRNGRTVIRPDSGDVVETNIALAKVLADKFGARINASGFKVLNDKVRILQGDGMDNDKINRLMQAAVENGFAAENWVVGQGGGLLQRVNRDTQRFAFKCSEVTIHGLPVPVQKDPKTDPTKRSKSGAQNEGMELVFSNGTLLRDTKFEDIRVNAGISLEQPA